MVEKEKESPGSMRAMSKNKLLIEERAELIIDNFHLEKNEDVIKQIVYLIVELQIKQEETEVNLACKSDDYDNLVQGSFYYVGGAFSRTTDPTAVVVFDHVNHIGEAIVYFPGSSTDGMAEDPSELEPIVSDDDMGKLISYVYDATDSWGEDAVYYVQYRIKENSRIPEEYRIAVDIFLKANGNLQLAWICYTISESLYPYNSDR